MSSSNHEPDWIEVEDEATTTTWRVDADFLRSRWSCRWGKGCHGILPEPAAELNQGCCSYGAHLDGDEPATIDTLARFLEADQWQFQSDASDGGIFSDDTNTNTRVVEGACIFLNRPGFAGGEGCALHLAALAGGESPLDWKPSVCWQLPIRVDWEDRGDGCEVATLHRWTRADWGEIGEEMAWCCTEGEEAYVGDRPVVESLAEELEEVVGREVFVALRRRV
jgi:hypothetical protein